MSRSNWVCSADHDCLGPFASRRRPKDHDRAHDAGECLMHRAPAFRSLTRRQRKILGWPEAMAREWVQSVGPDARDRADEFVDAYIHDHQVTDGLDGPAQTEVS